MIVFSCVHQSVLAYRRRLLSFAILVPRPVFVHVNFVLLMVIVLNRDHLVACSCCMLSINNVQNLKKKHIFAIVWPGILCSVFALFIKILIFLMFGFQFMVDSYFLNIEGTRAWEASAQFSTCTNFCKILPPLLKCCRINCFPSAIKRGFFHHFVLYLLIHIDFFSTRIPECYIFVMFIVILFCEQLELYFKIISFIIIWYHFAEEYMYVSCLFHIFCYVIGVLICCASHIAGK